MKIRLWERFVLFLSGLCLVASGAVVGLVSLNKMPDEWLQWVSGSGQYIALAAAIVLVVLGLHSAGILFRRKKVRKGFVLQKTENGELSISIKAMENLVQKCVDKHDELKIISTGIANTRDGVIVKLKIGLANGVSIPLAVNSLQKQIRQYLTACSGIEVQEVRVQVETATADVKDSPYAISEPEMPVLAKEPEAPSAVKLPVMPEPVAEPVVQQPVPAPIQVTPVEEPVVDEPKRPLHQRLFGHQDQPAIVPMPPVAADVAEDADSQESAVSEAPEAGEKKEMAEQNEPKLTEDEQNEAN